MTVFQTEFKLATNKDEDVYFLDIKGDRIVAPMALPNGNYQFIMFKQSIAVSVKDGLAYKAWQAPTTRFYKPLPEGYILGPDSLDIRKLLEIHFADCQRSNQFVEGFFKGHTVIEVEIKKDPKGDITDTETILTEADILDKTRDDLMKLAFTHGLLDYINVSMKAEELQEVIREHLIK